MMFNTMFCEEGGIMKVHTTISAALGTMLVALSSSALATNIVITAFSGNGEITWTNDVTNVTYRVQWASSLQGQDVWQNDWRSLNTIPSGTNTSFLSSVPMFYQVVIPWPPDDLAAHWHLTSHIQVGTPFQVAGGSLKYLTNSIFSREYIDIGEIGSGIISGVWHAGASVVTESVTYSSSPPFGAPGNTNVFDYTISNNVLRLDSQIGPITEIYMK